MMIARKHAGPDEIQEDGAGRAKKSSDAFRTIGEAAAELGLKAHVLRFWETKFPDLKPMKRPDGRRFYRPEDMELLRTLQVLLHEQGLTIRGAVKALADGDITAAREVDAEAGVADTDVEAGASVRDLQEAVRDAVERGEFRAAVEAETSSGPAIASDGASARARLESLLADLTGLKSRLDAVRTAA
jgi:DNA-binding transcriptional MerR regulator